MATVEQLIDYIDLKISQLQALEVGSQAYTDFKTSFYTNNADLVQYSELVLPTSEIGKDVLLNILASVKQQLHFRLWLLEGPLDL